MEELLSRLPGVLLHWYACNKRDLPWRKDREPYHVWLSEIMLQQTRVEAVRGYYARFLEALPTVEELAVCDDDRLYKLWEGLGYYSRVRNLKKAAGIICSEFGGVFPNSYEEVRSLPGIGEYTAGAICSICFELPVPAVDGNVLRLVSRLTDNDTPIDLPERKKQVRELLEAVYPAQAGMFTQALMELGATLCGPNRAPDCDCCPCKDFCLGYQRGTAVALPVKSPKKTRRTEDKTVLILRFEDSYALTRRPDTGLLAGLWQFPELPGLLQPQEVIAHLEEMGLRPVQLLRQADKQHIFTHVLWNMRGFYVQVAEPAMWTWLTQAQIDRDAALPTAYRQFWSDRI